MLEGEFAGVGFESDYILLVVGGGALTHGGGKLAGAIVHFGDDAGGGRAIDVHVPDGEEDADALPGAAGVFFIGDDNDAAVGGRNDGAGVSGDGALWIAEKVKDEGGEAEKDYAGKG